MFDIPIQVLLGQVTIGLVNGCFYAMLSLGLAIIFGLLNVINFAHGALYMLGAFGGYLLLQVFGVNYWWSLLIVPIGVGLIGAAIERLFLRRLAGHDHLYSLLFTFGLAIFLEGIFRDVYGAAGRPYPVPAALRGFADIGFMRLPIYRVWIVAASLLVCVGIWLLIEKTKLGSYLRAGTENSRLVQALGVNVPVMITATYALGVALAGFAGMLAAPLYQVQPAMGSNLLIVTFAVVVIGGLGSLSGAILSGLALGVLEGLSKVIYPEVSSTVVFIVMAVILLLRPAGLMGREA
jgi:branched-chain amino acid transport system permease protein